MRPEIDLIEKLFKEMYPDNFDAERVQDLIWTKYRYVHTDVIKVMWASYVNERQRLAQIYSGDTHGRLMRMKKDDIL